MMNTWRPFWETIGPHYTVGGAVGTSLFAWGHGTFPLLIRFLAHPFMH